jgi:hypothetical protein
VAWAEPLEDETVTLVLLLGELVVDVDVDVSAAEADVVAEASYTPTSTATEAAMPPAMAAIRFFVMRPPCCRPVWPP